MGTWLVFLPHQPPPVASAPLGAPFCSYYHRNTKPMIPSHLRQRLLRKTDWEVFACQESTGDKRAASQQQQTQGPSAESVPTWARLTQEETGFCFPNKGKVVSDSGTWCSPPFLGRESQRCPKTISVALRPAWLHAKGPWNSVTYSSTRTCVLSNC